MPDLDLFLHRVSEPRTWSELLVVAVGSLLAAMLIHRLVVSLLGRAVVRSPVAAAALARTLPPGGWLLPLLAVQAAWEAAPERLPGLAIVQHLTAIALIVAVARTAVAAVAGVQEAIELARPPQGADDFGGRRLQTQIRVLARTANVLIVLLAVALVLTTFPSVRHVGASLLASAGVAGIVAGFAARPVLGNLIAGLQIGLSQPIRLDDVVIVEGEWGVIEEITGTYVVIRIWDDRRLVVPLQWWIEHPFQNWTRHSTQLLGTVILWVDYGMPVEPLRAELLRVCEAAPEWDRRVALLQVTEASERALQVRALVSAGDAGRTWDLRCRVREALVAFVQREYPDGLPRVRADNRMEPPQATGAGAEREPASMPSTERSAPLPPLGP
jgi:small-conductance mechanosensitive channel